MLIPIRLLTQTKPLERTQSGLKSGRSLLAGSSVLFEGEGGLEAEPAFEMSSTQKGTSEGDIIDDDSPERAEPSSRRQSLGDTEGDEDGDEAEDEGDEVDDAANPTEEPADSRTPNAFERLMSAGQRPLTKHQKQAKARIRSNLVDEQAEESDEDDWFVGPKTGDDEEEDGDEDAYLADLVDDAAVADDIRQKEDALAAAKARYVLRSLRVRKVYSADGIAGRCKRPTTQDSKRTPVKSSKVNTATGGEAGTSTPTMMKMGTLTRRSGQRSRSGRGSSGWQTVFKSSVSTLVAHSML